MSAFGYKRTLEKWQALPIWPGYRFGMGGGLKPSHLPLLIKSDISPVARGPLGALLYASLARTGHELWSMVASRTSM